jgi:hypothetical protein
MSKLQVLGPRRLLPTVLAFLQGRGVLDLRSPAPLGSGAPRTALRLVPLRPGEQAAESALSGAVEASLRLLGSLPRAGRGEAVDLVLRTVTGEAP